MSGLFSRLAQQHIAQRSSSIMPAPSPVFPILLGEQDAGAIERHQDQLSRQRKPEAGTQIKITDTIVNDSTNSSVSDSPKGNEPDVGRQKDHAAITQSLTPVIKSVTKAGGIHEEVTPISTVTPSSTPEARSSIQPQLPGEAYSLPTPSVSGDGKESSSAKVEESELTPGNGPIPKLAVNSHQVFPSIVSNRNAQSTENFAPRKHEETQTTINVSIGQIEIRATQAEKLEKKAPTSSNRTRSNALEEYHQKRVRGER